MSLLLAALALAAAPADTDVLDLSKPEAVAAALQQGGYKAELKKDDDGTPYIVSAANGQPFTVNLYGCEKGACDSLDYQSFYNPEPLFTPALANEWNQNNRFLTVSVNAKGQLREWSYVSLIGKLTRKHFIDTVEWYASMDSKLTKFLNDRRTPAKK